MAWKFEEESAKPKVRLPLVDFGNDAARQHMDRVRRQFETDFSAARPPADSIRGRRPTPIMVDDLPEGAYAVYREQIRGMSTRRMREDWTYEEEDPVPEPVSDDDELFRRMLSMLMEMSENSRNEFLDGMIEVEEHRELAERLREWIERPLDDDDGHDPIYVPISDNFQGTLRTDPNGDFSIDWGNIQIDPPMVPPDGGGDDEPSMQFERPRMIVNLNSSETREYLVGSTEGEIVVDATQASVHIRLHDICPEMVDRHLTIRRSDDTEGHYVTVTCPGQIGYYIDPGTMTEFVYYEEGVLPVGQEFPDGVDHGLSVGGVYNLNPVYYTSEGRVEWSPEPVECALCGQLECEHMGNTSPPDEEREVTPTESPLYHVDFNRSVPTGVAAPTECESLDGGDNENDSRAFDVVCTECGRESTVCIVGPVRVHPQCMSCGQERLTIRMRTMDPPVH